MDDDLNSIDDIEEVLNRQVPPGLWNTADGEPMWTAFGPQSPDAGLMSTLRGHVTPEEAYRRHTEVHKLRSMGTWGVLVGDARDNGLPCLDDGGRPGVPADHASVDFRRLTKKEIREARFDLHARSLERGPLHTPGTTAGGTPTSQ